jgi:release factor glutamine methyltransferase
MSSTKSPHKLTLKTIATSASAKLNSADAAFEAQLLLQHVLGVNRAWLIAHENDALEAINHAEFEALLKRRLNGEPIAYILGYREFYGLKLQVTADTLIPRPDTETLVEAALAKTPQNQTSKILDLGTGTGAIALAIAHNCPQALVTAVDASVAALKIAQENAQSLAITNIEFLQSDWYSALKNQKFDVIVSNPPYIAQNDAHLSQGDLRFEPTSALASGADGLDDIKQIIANAPKCLTPHGCLLLEHGYNQAEEVATLLKQSGFCEIETINDLGGNNRVTLGMMME